MKYTKKDLTIYIKQNSNMADQEIFWLLSHILNLTQAEIISQPAFNLTEDQKANLDKAIYGYSVLHKPLQYILGFTDFLNLKIKVQTPILIPRPETEEWVDNLMKSSIYLNKNNINILDMCTGTGVIGLSLAKAFNNAHIYLADINPDACKLTQENAEKNTINNITCIVSDLFKNIPSNLKFDLITINPPYISFSEYENLDLNVKNWEDIRALAAEDNGLYLIKKFAQESKNYLTNSAQIVIEIGYNQKLDVIEILQNLDYKDIVCEKDFAGNDRVVKAKN